MLKERARDMVEFNFAAANDETLKILTPCNFFCGYLKIHTKKLRVLFKKRNKLDILYHQITNANEIKTKLFYLFAMKIYVSNSAFSPPPNERSLATLPNIAVNHRRCRSIDGATELYSRTARVFQSDTSILWILIML